MNKIEENIIHSFRLAKRDIIKLQNDLIKLEHSHANLVSLLADLKSNQDKLSEEVKKKNKHVTIVKKPIVKKVVKKAPVKKVVKKATKKRTVNKYIAPKGGKRFHQPNCPFAQNIKPKNRIIFKSKTTALNEGFKPCNCVKK